MANTLAPRHQAQIERIVALGGHTDADHVIGEALELLEARTRRLFSLRAELQVALDQEGRGDIVDYTPETMERLMAEADERTRLGLPVRDAVKP
jgi:Arc/MetJ-type ribon-helix-helix transcriptional regulator